MLEAGGTATDRLALPHSADAVVAGFFTCEFTTLDGQGRPVTWPVEPYYERETGELIVTASIAFPVKAHNAARNPRVAMLFSDPTGSGIGAAPAVLIQGRAQVSEAREWTPHAREHFRQSVLRQPASRTFVRNALARKLFTFYFQRLNIVVRPERALVWPERDFAQMPVEIGALVAPTTAAQPGPLSTQEWNTKLAARIVAYNSAVVSCVDSSGYPTSARCDATVEAADRVIRLNALPPSQAAWCGPASVLFHRHDAELEQQYQLQVRGTLEPSRDAHILRVARFLTANGSRDQDRMPHAGAPLQLFQFMRFGRRQAGQYLRRRGGEWSVDFKPMLDVLREIDSEPGSGRRG
jgi:pyridoxamine 5'-phosphate oxidase-like protein